MEGKREMINVALVGCGRIAIRHSDLLGNHQVPGAKLVAVCDLIAQKARSIGARHHVPWFTDMDVMMIEMGKNIDVISVLTPSGLHAEHVLHLAEFKKHIIVEKPMALKTDAAEAMIRACDRKGVRLFVVMQNRFNVPVQRLRRALESGRFGKFVLGTVRVRWCRTQAYYDQDSWRGTWAYDGGVLANQASHHIDLLHWMMGDVQCVFAKGIRALAQVEVEDTAVATLKFKSGALGIIEATTATRPQDIEASISILGENGAVEIGGIAVNLIKTWQFASELPEDGETVEKYSVNPPNIYGFGHQAYYENVVDCLTNGAVPLVDGCEGRKNVELISALYESIATGREIQVPIYSQHSQMRVRHGQNLEAMSLHA
jgi:UDP-N-acetyl-2-amino-2-deoxyglucuronate dehydrogenase